MKIKIINNNIKDQLNLSINLNYINPEYIINKMIINLFIPLILLKNQKEEESNKFKTIDINEY